jgi:heptosyltransferase-2
VIRCLRNKFPDAEIHYLTKHSFKDILSSNPHINKVLTLEDDFDKMLEQLKAEAYDHVIDLHHNVRTLRVKRFLKKVPSASFNKLNVGKFIYTNLKINTLPKKHIVDRYLETVSPFGVENDGKGLDFFIPERDVVKKDDIPTSHQTGYIGIAIGAAVATKKLPVHKLKELCAAIHHPVILLGGKEDYEAGKEIASVDETKIYNSCGKFNLNESADLVRNAKLIITHDTGLMHIAVAFQKPVVSVWGNTVPSFGMYPYYGTRSNQQYSAVQVNKLWCRPCSKIGYKKCPLGHFKCMERIDIAEMNALVNRYLGR